MTLLHVIRTFVCSTFTGYKAWKISCEFDLVKISSRPITVIARFTIITAMFTVITARFTVISASFLAGVGYRSLDGRGVPIGRSVFLDITLSLAVVPKCFNVRANAFLFFETIDLNYFVLSRKF